MNIFVLGTIYEKLIRYGENPESITMQKLRCYIDDPDVVFKEINTLEQELISARKEISKLKEELKELS